VEESKEDEKNKRVCICINVKVKKSQNANYAKYLRTFPLYLTSLTFVFFSLLKIKGTL
jgi:hypothetical protein